jgi:hypothetical protein
MGRVVDRKNWPTYRRTPKADLVPSISVTMSQTSSAASWLASPSRTAQAYEVPLSQFAAQPPYSLATFQTQTADGALG